MFGPYRIEELLGRGGMGEVYRAHDTQTERTVALKVLPPHLAADGEYQTRFRRECAAAASLNEPHVVPIHHFGDVDGRLFLDMRLVNGLDLGAWLGAHGPMAPEVAVSVVTQVAQALDAAHAEGLVHRDVKPSNVLLAGITGPDVDVAQVFAYLLDFGIARSRDDAPLTAVGQIVGTHRYMAPERFEGSEGDPAADVYALACVLHQALTGTPPFTGRLTELMTAHLHQPPPQPSRLRAGVPAGLDDVVATGMAKDPAQRYSAAGDLARAARAAIGGTSGYLPVPAVDDGAGPGRTTRVTPASHPAPPHPAPPRPAPPRPVPTPPAYEPVSQPRFAPPPVHEQLSQPRFAPPPVHEQLSRPRLSPPPAYEEVPFAPPVPPPAAQPRRSSRARLAALAVAAFVVAAVVAGVALYGIGAFAPTPPPPPPSDDAKFVTALPTGFGVVNGTPNCQRLDADRQTSGALSYLRCQPGPVNGPTTAQFARFPTREQLDREFDRQAGTELKQAQGTPNGCGKGDTVRSSWSRGADSGSLICYVAPDSKAYLLWTDISTLSLGYVRRDDGNAAVLYDWWNRARFRA